MRSGKKVTIYRQFIIPHKRLRAPAMMKFAMKLEINAVFVPISNALVTFSRTSTARLSGSYGGICIEV